MESNLDAHIKIDDVLAVPEPPINNTPFWTNEVEEWIGLGWVKIALTMY